MSLEKIKSSVNIAADALDSTMKDSISFLKSKKEQSVQKLSGMVNNILGLAPLIEATGFNMRRVDVDAAIPPSISLTFLKEKDVSPETVEKILEENKDKNMLNLIVKGLQKADSMQKGMNLSGYVFQEMKMKIGLPPDISLMFVRKKGEEVVEAKTE
jgi:hypothetical protein